MEVDKGPFGCVSCKQQMVPVFNQEEANTTYYPFGQAEVQKFVKQSRRTTKRIESSKELQDSPATTSR